jgi:hypothetical protein
MTTVLQSPANRHAKEPSCLWVVREMSLPPQMCFLLLYSTRTVCRLDVVNRDNGGVQRSRDSGRIEPRAFVVVKKTQTIFDRLLVL